MLMLGTSRGDAGRVFIAAHLGVSENERRRCVGYESWERRRGRDSGGYAPKLYAGVAAEISSTSNGISDDAGSARTLTVRVNKAGPPPGGGRLDASTVSPDVGTRSRGGCWPDCRLRSPCTWRAKAVSRRGPQAMATGQHRRPGRTGHAHGRRADSPRAVATQQVPSVKAVPETSRSTPQRNSLAGAQSDGDCPKRSRVRPSTLGTPAR